MYKFGHLDHIQVQDASQCTNRDVFVGHNMNNTPCSLSTPSSDSIPKSTTTSVLRRWRRPDPQDSTKNAPPKDVQISVNSAPTTEKQMNYVGSTDTPVNTGNDFSMYVPQLSPLVPQSTARPYDNSKYLVQYSENGAYRSSQAVPSQTKEKNGAIGQNPYFHQDGTNQEIHFRNSTYPMQSTPPLAHSASQKCMVPTENTNYPSSKVGRDYDFSAHNYTPQKLNTTESKEDPSYCLPKPGYVQDNRISPQNMVYSIQNSMDRRLSPHNAKSPIYRNPQQSYVTPATQNINYLSQKTSYQPDKPVIDPRYVQNYNQNYYKAPVNSHDAKYGREYRNAANPKKVSPPFPILEHRLNQIDSNYPEYSVQGYYPPKYGAMMYSRTSPTSKVLHYNPKIPPQEVMIPPTYQFPNKYYQQNQGQVSKEYDQNLYLSQMNQMQARLSQSKDMPRDLSHIDPNQKLSQKNRMFSPESNSVEHIQYSGKSVLPVSQKSPKIYNTSEQRTIENFNLSRSCGPVVKPTEYQRNSKVGEYSPVIQPLKPADLGYDPKLSRDYLMHQQASEQQNYACSPPLSGSNPRNATPYYMGYPRQPKVNEIPPRNISPRRTFQENMPVVVFSPHHIGLPNSSPTPMYPPEYPNPQHYPGFYPRDSMYPEGVKPGMAQYPIDHAVKYPNFHLSRNISQQRYYGFPDHQAYQHIQESSDKNYYQGNMYRAHYPENLQQNVARSFESDFRTAEASNFDYEAMRSDERAAYSKKEADIGKSLKEFLESWEDDEEIVANLPDLVLCNNIPADKQKLAFAEISDETNEQFKSSCAEEKQKEPHSDQPLYILGSTNISSEVLPQYLAVYEQVDRLPANIKGFYEDPIQNKSKEQARPETTEKITDPSKNSPLTSATESLSPHDLTVNKNQTEEKEEVLNLSTNRKKENNEFLVEEYSNASEDNNGILQNSETKKTITEQTDLSSKKTSVRDLENLAGETDKIVVEKNITVSTDTDEIDKNIIGDISEDKEISKSPCKVEENKDHSSEDCLLIVKLRESERLQPFEEKSPNNDADADKIFAHEAVAEISLATSVIVPNKFFDNSAISTKNNDSDKFLDSSGDKSSKEVSVEIASDSTEKIIQEIDIANSEKLHTDKRHIETNDTTDLISKNEKDCKQIPKKIRKHKIEDLHEELEPISFENLINSPENIEMKDDESVSDLGHNDEAINNDLTEVVSICDENTNELIDSSIIHKEANLSVLQNETIVENKISSEQNSNEEENNPIAKLDLSKSIAESNFVMESNYAPHKEINLCAVHNETLVGDKISLLQNLNKEENSATPKLDLSKSLEGINPIMELNSASEETEKIETDSKNMSSVVVLDDSIEAKEFSKNLSDMEEAENHNKTLDENRKQNKAENFEFSKNDDKIVSEDEATEDTIVLEKDSADSSHIIPMHGYLLKDDSIEIVPSPIEYLVSEDQEESNIVTYCETRSPGDDNTASITEVLTETALSKEYFSEDIGEKVEDLDETVIAATENVISEINSIEGTAIPEISGLEKSKTAINFKNIIATAEVSAIMTAEENSEKSSASVKESLEQATASIVSTNGDTNEMVASSKEDPNEMVSSPKEDLNEMVVSPEEDPNETVASPKEDQADSVSSMEENLEDIARAVKENSEETVASLTKDLEESIIPTVVDLNVTDASTNEDLSEIIASTDSVANEIMSAVGKNMSEKIIKCKSPETVEKEDFSSTKQVNYESTVDKIIISNVETIKDDSCDSTNKEDTLENNLEETDVIVRQEQKTENNELCSENNDDDDEYSHLIEIENSEDIVVKEKLNADTSTVSLTNPEYLNDGSSLNMPEDSSHNLKNQNNNFDFSYLESCPDNICEKSVGETGKNSEKYIEFFNNNLKSILESSESDSDISKDLNEDQNRLEVTLKKNCSNQEEDISEIQEIITPEVTKETKTDNFETPNYSNASNKSKESVRETNIEENDSDDQHQGENILKSTAPEEEQDIQVSINRKKEPEKEEESCGKGTEQEEVISVLSEINQQTGPKEIILIDEHNGEIENGDNIPMLEELEKKSTEIENGLEIEIENDNILEVEQISVCVENENDFVSIETKEVPESVAEEIFSESIISEDTLNDSFISETVIVSDVPDCNIEVSKSVFDNMSMENVPLNLNSDSLIFSATESNEEDGLLLPENSQCVVYYDGTEEYIIIQPDTEISEIITEELASQESEISINEHSVEVNSEKEEKDIIENTIEEPIGEEIIICQESIENWVQNEEIINEEDEKTDTKLDEIIEEIFEQQNESPVNIIDIIDTKNEESKTGINDKKLSFEQKKLIIEKRKKKLEKFKREKLLHTKNLTETFITKEKHNCSVRGDSKNSDEEKELFMNPENPISYSISETNLIFKRRMSYNEHSSPKIDFKAPKRRYSTMETERSMKKPIINLDEISKNITEVLENLNKKKSLQYQDVKKRKSETIMKREILQETGKEDLQLEGKKLPCEKIETKTDNFKNNINVELHKLPEKSISVVEKATNIPTESSIRDNFSENVPELVKQLISPKLIIPKTSYNIVANATFENKRNSEPLSLTNQQRRPSLLKSKDSSPVTNTARLTEPVFLKSVAVESKSSLKRLNIDPRIERPTELPETEYKKSLIDNKLSNTFSLTEYTQNYIKMKTGQVLESQNICAINAGKATDPRLKQTIEENKTNIINSLKRVHKTASSENHKKNQKKVKINLQDYRNRKLSQSDSTISSSENSVSSISSSQYDDTLKVEDKIDIPIQEVVDRKTKNRTDSKHSKEEISVRDVDEKLIKPKKSLGKVTKESLLIPVVSKITTNSKESKETNNTNNLDCKNLKTVNKINSKSKIDLKHRPKKRKRRFRNLYTVDEDDEMPIKQQKNSLNTTPRNTPNEDLESSNIVKIDGSDSSNGTSKEFSCCLDLNSNGTVDKNGLKCHIALSPKSDKILDYEINKNSSDHSNKLKLTLKTVQKKKPAFSEVLSNLDSFVETKMLSKECKRKDSKSVSVKNGDGAFWTVKTKIPKVIIKRKGTGYCAVSRGVVSNPIWQPKIRLKRQRYIESLVLNNNLQC